MVCWLLYDHSDDADANDDDQPCNDVSHDDAVDHDDDDASV